MASMSSIGYVNAFRHQVSQRKRVHSNFISPISHMPAALVSCKQIFIPSIPIVCQWKVHPKCEDLRSKCEDWMLSLVEPESFEQKRSILCQDLVLLAGMLFPNTTEARFWKLFRFVSWFTLLDTHMDNMEELGANMASTNSIIDIYTEIVEDSGNNRLMEVPEKHKKLIRAFTKSWNELFHDMPPQQAKCFRDDALVLFSSSKAQNKLREEGIVLSMDELVAQRRTVTSFLLLIHLVQYSLGLEMNARIFEDPEVVRFCEVASDYMIFCNDLLSFRVEYLDGDFHNIICTIANADNVSLQDAIWRLQELANNNTQELSKLYSCICAKYNTLPEVEQYLNGVKHLIAANLEWSWRTGRYHGPGWVAPQERQGIMFIEPATLTAQFHPCAKP